MYAFTVTIICACWKLAYVQDHYKVYRVVQSCNSGFLNVFILENPECEKAQNYMQSILTYWDLFSPLQHFYLETGWNRGNTIRHTVKENSSKHNCASVSVRSPGEGPTPHLLLQLCSLWGQRTSAPALEEIQREAVEEDTDELKKYEGRRLNCKSDDGINWTELWVLKLWSELTKLCFLRTDLQWTFKAENNPSMITHCWLMLFMLIPSNNQIFLVPFFSYLYLMPINPSMIYSVWWHNQN